MHIYINMYVLRDIYVHICNTYKQLEKKVATYLKESRKRYMVGFAVRKGKEK